MKFKTTHTRVTTRIETVDYIIEAEDWDDASSISDNMSIDDETMEVTVINRDVREEEADYQQTEPEEVNQ
jgi:hypothetical protein